jgi:hypothetical protein
LVPPGRHGFQFPERDVYETHAAEESCKVVAMCKIRCRACSISSRLAVGLFDESMLHPQPGVRLRLVQNV